MNKPHRFRNTTFCCLLAGTLFVGTLAGCSAGPDTDTSVDTPTVPLAELHTGSFQILNAFSAVGSSSKTAQLICRKI
jgi:hypothetical protein